MVVLYGPLLYNGVTYPADTRIMLPADFEEKIVAAGNGELVVEDEPETAGAPKNDGAGNGDGEPVDGNEDPAEGEPLAEGKKRSTRSNSKAAVVEADDELIASQQTFGRGLEG